MENKCKLKLDENEICVKTSQCLGDMSCTSQKECQCSSGQYFHSLNIKCQNQTLNNTTCSEDRTCRVDLGLSCQNDLCQCDYMSQFWSSINTSCINYLKYNESKCESTTQCDTIQNLICFQDQCKHLFM